MTIEEKSRIIMNARADLFFRSNRDASKILGWPAQRRCIIKLRMNSRILLTDQPAQDPIHSFSVPDDRPRMPLVREYPRYECRYSQLWDSPLRRDRHKGIYISICGVFEIR